MNRGSRRRGYSLIEAMVSVALLSIGIVAVLGAYTSLTNGQRRAIGSDVMQRLAHDKYEELVATEALQTQALNGDFSDRGDQEYVWEATVEPTGTENLSALTVIVQPRDSGDNGPRQLATGVVFVPPQGEDPETAAP